MDGRRAEHPAGDHCPAVAGRLRGAARLAAHPACPLVVSGVLIVQAWWMVLNAKSEYDSIALQYIPLSPWLNWAPGSLHKAFEPADGYPGHCVAGRGLLLLHLARRPIWRKRLLWTMALTGLSLVVLGLAQRLSGAPVLLGKQTTRVEPFSPLTSITRTQVRLSTSFAPDRRLALDCYRKEGHSRERHFWSAGLILCLAGVFVMLRARPT